ncbi:hypothetical protein BDV95DRAFT_130750 [Massariosphaeria phaeospora]|uniref:Uncharacterized protein n=1 Tax=Massariosphaeria phaeospora TaxID=100035 RepID=A0A7C8I5B0_9PLEO|nr:hypothetical protein BDV95DRAFT_130750 [Massariosphaeria phaeospora]
MAIKGIPSCFFCFRIGEVFVNGECYVVATGQKKLTTVCLFCLFLGGGGGGQKKMWNRNPVSRPAIPLSFALPCRKKPDEHPTHRPSPPSYPTYARLTEKEKEKERRMGRHTNNPKPKPNRTEPALLIARRRLFFSLDRWNKQTNNSRSWVGFTGLPFSPVSREWGGRGGKVLVDNRQIMKEGLFATGWGLRSCSCVGSAPRTPE